jgi:hypothetical protein
MMEWEKPWSLMNKQLYKNAHLESQHKTKHPFHDGHVGLESGNIFIPLVQSGGGFEGFILSHTYRPEGVKNLTLQGAHGLDITSTAQIPNKNRAAKLSIFLVNKKSNSPAVHQRRKVNNNETFFFEPFRRPDSDDAAKRPLRHRDAGTKKRLPRDAKVVPTPQAKNYQSFFASFCSQKEVLSFRFAF